MVEVHPEKLVEEFSTAVDKAGFVPAPMILTDGNPPLSADLKTSIVTDPLGEPISFHPSNVPPYGILTYPFVPVVSTLPEPSTAKLTVCPDPE